MNNRLFKEERLMRIMDKIHKNGKVVVADLAQEFELSKPSIRLDLAELESRGLIERTHGGAILKNVNSSRYIAIKNDLELRKEIYKEEKQRIGQAVVTNLIHDGDSIMIDGGSTVYYVAKNIGMRRGLTIITSTLSLLPLMMDIPDAKLYLTGGLLHKEFEDLIGDISVSTLRRFKTNYAIFGIDAISVNDGLFSTESSTAEIKKQMLASGAKSIVVADSSKFGNVSLCHVAELEDIDFIVTDKNIPQEYVSQIKDAGVKLVIV